MAILLERPHSDRRFAALALTALVHALLLLGWQATRRLPSLDAGRDGRRIQWIQLAPPAPAAPAERPSVPPAPARARTPARTTAVPSAPGITITVPAPVAAPAAGVAPATPAPADQATSPAPAGAPAATGPLVQRALREAGSVARALRKENNPYIVAPPDSPQIRMRKGMEAAHEAVPNALYQAPKIDELVDHTGYGARRTRVRSGPGTYCITNDAVNAPTGLDTMRDGVKSRTSTCYFGEDPATQQEWRTARDP